MPSCPYLPLDASGTAISHPLLKASFRAIPANLSLEHTLLVTETGVEVLTARLENSPGGPIPMPTKAGENGDSKKD